MYDVFSKLLQERDVTAYAVSKATGVSQSTLSDWKNGKSVPKIDKLKLIADYFGVQLEAFTTPEGNAAPDPGKTFNIPVFESVSAGFGAYASSAVIDRIPMFFVHETDAAIKANREDIENNSLIPSLTADIKEVERKIDNLIRLAENTENSASLSARLNDLEAQRKDLSNRLASANSEVIVLEREHVIYWLEKFSHGDIEDPEFCRAVCDLFVNSVTVWDEPDGYKITTIYNLSENNTKTYRVSSDFGKNGSPQITYPNFSVFFGAYWFGVEKIMRRG